MAEAIFTDKFIAFIDILGFKQMVEAAEAGTGMSLDELLSAVQELGRSEDQNRFEKHGPTMCPHSSFKNRSLDFKITQISDCVIVSSEVSPAGVLNLVSYCWGAVIQLLRKGIMCRGYITRGMIYHTEGQIIGTGYQKAYKSESQVTAFKRQADERGTPFVEVDSVVCDYVLNHGDDCVKKMFERCVKSDGDVTALFPFKMLSHSFIIAGFGHVFDPDKEKASNDKMRVGILKMIERVMALADNENPRALSKVEHYVTALKAQLEQCDKTDELIDCLNSPLQAERLWRS